MYSLEYGIAVALREIYDLVIAVKLFVKWCFTESICK